MRLRASLLIAVFALALATPCFAKVKLVLMPKRENVRAHFEEGTPALMEEERVVALEAGVNQVELAWENLPIVPQSILFDPIDGAKELTTLAVSTPPSGQSALIWWVKATAAGNYRLRITYALAGGLAVERIDYTARANAEETSLQVSGRARLYNGSGLDQSDMSVEIGASQSGGVSLQRDERRDVSLADPAAYELTKRYVSDSATGNGRVQLVYEWTLPKDKAPQLAGKARAFLATGGTAAGQLDTFLGESRLGYTQRGEEAKLFVGFANNVEVKRTLVRGRDENIKFTKVPPNGSRAPAPVLWDRVREWKIELKNHTEKEITVRLVEHAVGQWEVTSELKPTEVKDIGTLHFDIPVKAGETMTVTYTINQRNCEPGEPSL
jgi:hypothetical protein